jgi:glutaredoxin 3
MSDVKVYSTPTCPWCAVVKEFLVEHGVDFEEVDVAADQKALFGMVSKSGQMGVPQIEINGKMIVGFNKAALEQELENMESYNFEDE